ncbi:Pantothenate synthetase [Psilocybe cubensis]|uniref:Pantoate--beta-alanine ligase n=2 Tax=Psilocybe cubensis TaxID=181762 RepID=A0A8H7XSR5_PSICU|nr:Pantothenate synthetase [Psilocybe cubensis]KAH9479328.1 Pantothenate synthetase [Psilocybe cubensis]
MTSKATESLPVSSIPIFTTVADYRAWRNKAFADGKTVGFVPTMGALHDGHLSLVRESLAHNDLTVVSIFVNPAQFAPHEDLATYPRTLPRDLELLEAEKVPSAASPSEVHTPSAVFVPTVSEMYPSGIVQNVAEQKGTFIEVKGYGHQMEGVSRPTFFRGVATVVTKLFNVVQPTNAYFGQKDIQQALLLKRLVRDLLLSHPEPSNLHIIPTTRDSTTGLALSSRNAYLSTDGYKVAPTLRQALQAAEAAWNAGHSKKKCIEAAIAVVESRKAQAQTEGLDVTMKLDYLEMNNAHTFDILDHQLSKKDVDLVILSGALNVDKTRLIDNILLGDTQQVLG